MCIALPKKIKRIIETATGAYAEVCPECDEDAPRGKTPKSERIDLGLINVPAVGDWILVFKDKALRVIDEDEAVKIQKALACVQAVMSGELDEAAIDAAFDDLGSADSRLPPHLRAQVQKTQSTDTHE